MAQKVCKSKNTEKPTVTFEAELIESKVRSISPYVRDVLRSCAISNEKGCRIRSVSQWEFSCYPPEHLARDDGCNTSEPSKIGAWSLEHIKAGAILPLREYFRISATIPTLHHFN
uniref:Uncharacterized protein n=1 Tax=Cannabis sativa TaxID=3483 RepID=A0A803NKA7_CANSA